MQAQAPIQNERSLISLIAVLLIAAAWVATFFEQSGRWRHHNVIVWDVQEYYAYLPATFIYNDLNFDFVENLPEDQKKHYWIQQLPDNKRTGRFTIGMAIMYMPFFLAGHLIAWLGGQPLTGLSTPYHFAIFLTGYVYGFLGLLMLRKILRLYFTELATAITLICIALGTNLYYYATTEGPMTHASLFFLFSVFCWHTIKWHKNPNITSLILIGLTGGLAVLIRPTSVFIGLFFILYNAHFKNALQDKLLLFRRNFKQLLLLVIVPLLVALPQLIYWKMQSGHWIFYSYGNEGFFFNDPQIIKGLFGFRKGWLVYTPIMIFSVAGFFFLRRYVKEAFLAILIYVILHVYVIFSWWCWWYGGSFGMRAMIESYILLALPMAALWQFLLRYRYKAVTFLVILVAAALLYLNRFQTMQYRSAIIHWDSMSKPYYKAIFLKNEWPSEEKLKLLSPPDYEAAMQGERDQ